MLKIKKNNSIKIVPNGSYNNYFKGQGWDVIGKVNLDEGQNDEWDSVISEVNEKPLNEMNRQELEEKAISLGIDLNGLGSTKQIREAVRRAMN